jgi:hypothetical protein
MPEDSKDDKYWRRRAKNNEAAKRSREAKRNKEDEVLTRVETLENANNLLRLVFILLRDNFQSQNFINTIAV